MSESEQSAENTEQGAVNFGVDVTVLSVETLREEYEELNERRFSRTITEKGRQRKSKVWSELRKLTDVEQPECPECGARNWGFTDHTECMDCGYGPRMDEQDLLEDIQSAWDSIMARSEEAEA